jgi:hypothetical protein
MIDFQFLRTPALINSGSFATIGFVSQANLPSGGVRIRRHAGPAAQSGRGLPHFHFRSAIANPAPPP